MKLHKGSLENWTEEHFPQGYCVWGMFEGHPHFHGNFGHTSMVLSRDGNEIETLNSKYTLGKQMRTTECSGNLSPTV